MNNKKKLAEMQRRKQELEAKIAALREGKNFRNSLAFLIESTLDKTEVVLAAKAIVDKLSKMSEDLAKITADDVFPLMDALKEAFGPNMADAFQKNVSAQINAMTEAMVKAKDAVSSEVGKLEGVVNGEDVSDMGTFGDDAGAADPLATEDPLAAAAAPDAAPALDAAPAAPEAPEAPAADEGDDLDDIFGDDNAGAAGRARKESVQPKGRLVKEGRGKRLGKPLAEGILDSVKSFVSPHLAKVSVTGSPREKLESLKPFVTAEDYEFLAQCPDQLLASIFVAAEPAPTLVTNPPIVPPAPATPAVTPAMPPVDAALPAPVDHNLDDASLGMDADLGGDLAGPMGNDLAPGLDDVGLDDEITTFESVAAKRLRESRDPDALIVKAFKLGLREGATPVNAARAVSRAFGIDLADVIAIVKEAAPVPPVKPGDAAPAPMQGSTTKPANPADQVKAKTLATKIKAQNPAGVNDDAIINGVGKNITSVGKTQKDEPEMTDLVRAELNRTGSVKEESGDGTELPAKGPMPKPIENTLFSKPVAEGTKDTKWIKAGKTLKPKKITLPSKK
jgi:hypothetical protein